MVAKCSEPGPVNDKHQEHPMMAKSQASRHLINCKCRRTECCGMTCQNTDPLDEYARGTYHSDGRDSQIFKACGCRKPQHRSNCQATESSDENVKCSWHTDSGESQTTINKTSGKLNDPCSGHSIARKESHYEHFCSHCQQPSHNSSDDPCTGKQSKKRKDNCDCGMTCQQINPNGPCRSSDSPPKHLYCQDGKTSDCRIRCVRCQATIADHNCVSKKQSHAGIPEPTTPSTTHNTEPPESLEEQGNCI